jgi:hypothetical protein
MASLSHETIAFTNASTGVVHYRDVPTGQAMAALEAGVGDRIRLLGHEYTVMDTYDTYVEAHDGRNSWVIDLAAEPQTPAFSRALAKV